MPAHVLGRGLARARAHRHQPRPRCVDARQDARAPPARAAHRPRSLRTRPRDAARAAPMRSVDRPRAGRPGRARPRRVHRAVAPRRRQRECRLARSRAHQRVRQCARGVVPAPAARAALARPPAAPARRLGRGHRRPRVGGVHHALWDQRAGETVDRGRVGPDGQHQPPVELPGPRAARLPWRGVSAPGRVARGRGAGGCRVPGARHRAAVAVRLGRARRIRTRRAGGGVARARATRDRTGPAERHGHGGRGNHLRDRGLRFTRESRSSDYGAAAQHRRRESGRPTERRRPDGDLVAHHAPDRRSPARRSRCRQLPDPHPGVLRDARCRSGEAAHRRLVPAAQRLPAGVGGEGGAGTGGLHRHLRGRPRVDRHRPASRGVSARCGTRRTLAHVVRDLPRRLVLRFSARTDQPSGDARRAPRGGHGPAAGGRGAGCR